MVISEQTSTAMLAFGADLRRPSVLAVIAAAILVVALDHDPEWASGTAPAAFGAALIALGLSTMAQLAVPASRVPVAARQLHRFVIVRMLSTVCAGGLMIWFSLAPSPTWTVAAISTLSLAVVAAAATALLDYVIAVSKADAAAAPDPVT